MSESRLVFTREIPVRRSVDVMVAGGGPAGVAAAVTAARQGSAVFLAEGHTCFGGMGTAGLVPMFCQFSDGVHFLAGGIGREVYNEGFRRGETGPEDPELSPRKRHSMSIQPEALKRIYDDLVTESGARYAFCTRVIGVEQTGGRVACAICSGKSGIYAVRAKMFVDCTGDGDLAVMAGAPYKKGDEQGRMQSGTLCSLWAGIDWPRHRAGGTTAVWPKDQRIRVADAIRDGVLTIPDTSLPGMWRVGQSLGGGNIGHVFGVDGTDDESVTEALVWGRRLILEYERYYKEYLTGFEEMELAATGSLLGIRETRRIVGDYTLTLDDYRRRAVFADEIGRYNYGVDIHPPAPGAGLPPEVATILDELHLGRGESYGIPYRVLIPKDTDNVLVAGRCVSTDRYVNGSIRVMPGCFITGQAAGLAASLAVEERVGTRGVPVGELQARLRAMGGYLPTAR